MNNKYSFFYPKYVNPVILNSKTIPITAAINIYKIGCFLNLNTRNINIGNKINCFKLNKSKKLFVCLNESILIIAISKTL